MKKADIILNPFPFGHTNTLIDSLMCGKPSIGMNGPEPAAKTEGGILETVGLRDIFSSEDEQDYKKKFFAVAERIMNGEKEFFDRDKVYDRIYSGLGDYDYGKVMKWIFENHAEMKASGEKYFDAFQDMNS